MKFVVTGGAGFIGSHFVRFLLRAYPDAAVVNYDKLTYAGNPATLAGIEGDPRYGFVQGDICDGAAVARVIEAGDVVANFAAESHVDRSIVSSEAFLETNVRGVDTLLKVAMDKGARLFMQVSTDEVYGSIDVGSFSENSALNPSSPYSASKAAGDLLALSYFKTYGFPVVVTRSSNNFGPHQYPEKMIPLFVTNLLQGRRVPLYGDGSNVRDWIFVEDNCRALALVLREGAAGEIYNVGAGNEVSNLGLTKRILSLLGLDDSMIEDVDDRLGHDQRYSVDTRKLRSLGWAPESDFDSALSDTVAWYRANTDWWEPLLPAGGAPDKRPSAGEEGVIETP